MQTLELSNDSDAFEDNSLDDINLSEDIDENTLDTNGKIEKAFKKFQKIKDLIERRASKKKKWISNQFWS